MILFMVITCMFVVMMTGVVNKTTVKSLRIMIFGSGLVWSQFVAGSVFMSVFLGLSLSFLPWGFNPVSVTTVMFIVLIFFGQSVFISPSNSAALSSVESGSSVMSSIALFLIHTLSGLIMPVSLGLRLLINMSLGHFLMLLIFSSSSVVIGVSPFLGMMIFLCYKSLVLMIQSFLFAFLLSQFFSPGLK